MRKTNRPTVKFTKYLTEFLALALIRPKAGPRSL